MERDLALKISQMSHNLASPALSLLETMEMTEISSDTEQITYCIRKGVSLFIAVVSKTGELLSVELVLLRY